MLTVVVHPSYYYYEKYDIEEGKATRIHGIDISTPGVYKDTLSSIYGCDSVYHIVVNTIRKLEREDSVSICYGSYYEVPGGSGRKYSYADTYRDTIYPAGKDYFEVVITHLTVIAPSFSVTRKVVSVEDLPYAYDGRLYTQVDLPKDDSTYIFQRTIHNANSCDSIVYLEITRTSHYSPWYQFALCKGSSIKIDDVEITEPGQYQFTRRRIDPKDPRKSYMDSLYRIEVYLAPTYDLTLNRTICQGDTFPFFDKKLTTTGVYKEKGETKDGCDSIVTLYLEVTPAVHYNTYVRLWPDEMPYTWDETGETYRGAGDYTKVWYTNDCANTHTLHLTVVETDTVITQVVVCSADLPYVWSVNGQQYTTSTTDSKLDVNYILKTSTLYVLKLTVSSPTNIQAPDPDQAFEACANDREFDIHLKYTGDLPQYYSIYFGSAALREKFKNVYNEPVDHSLANGLVNEVVIRVQIPQSTQEAYRDHDGVSHPYYVRPDYYTMNIELNNGACGDNSRVNDVRFLIKYPSWIIEQQWDNIVAPLKKDSNGGFEFANIEWYNATRNYTYSGAETARGYLYVSGKLQEGDEIIANLTRKGEGYAIPTCPLEINEYKKDTYDDPTIKPNKAPRHTPVIGIEAVQEGTYEVYSSTGTLITTGTFAEGNTAVTLPAVCGIYLIRLVQGEHAITHKAVIY